MVGSLFVSQIVESNSCVGNILRPIYWQYWQKILKYCPSIWGVRFIGHPYLNWSIMLVTDKLWPVWPMVKLGGGKYENMEIVWPIWKCEEVYKGKIWCNVHRKGWMWKDKYCLIACAHDAIGIKRISNQTEGRRNKEEFPVHR